MIQMSLGTVNSLSHDCDLAALLQETIVVNAGDHAPPFLSGRVISGGERGGVAGSKIHSQTCVRFF